MDFDALTGVSTSTIETFGRTIFAGVTNFFLYALEFIFPFLLMIFFIFLVWGVVMWFRRRGR